ncbi:hypothetical protein STEG23_031326 [Scotinomys teguina]
MSSQAVELRPSSSNNGCSILSFNRPRNDHPNCVKNVKISLMPSVDFQETEVCLDFKEEYKYIKRFSGSFSSIQDSTKKMDIPNHMKNLNPLKLVRHILDCTLRGDFTADGLDQLTLCSQSPGFGTPAAPVQVLFKETESGQSTSVSKLTIISPDNERK